MKRTPSEIAECETPLTDEEFLQSYNKNMPAGYPLLSTILLRKFKEGHQSLFKADNLWTLDLHRKRMILWLPLNI